MLHDKISKSFWFTLFFLLFARLVAMAVIPLNDSTEARYGEIARIMAESGNWITPMQVLGEPFWAKPPLSMWLQAASMHVLGETAFAARLSALLLSIGILALIFHLARQERGHAFARWSVLILAASPYFFLNAGTVMTDPALLFSFTLSMVSFWFAIVRQERMWGYLFFVGLGLGLLAKGPLIGVLIGLPVFIWTLFNRAWRKLWMYLPWFLGSGLMLLIALPWYVLAELKTPGFLNYFIVGEHIHRFLDPAWSGDKYGFAHEAARGMIWLYAIVGVLPWLIYGSVTVFFQKGNIKIVWSPWLSYLISFMIGPLVFFTFSRNIIYPYAFPFLPGFALLFAELIVQFCDDKKRIAYYIANMTGIIFIVAAMMFVIKPATVAKSQDRVVALWQKHVKKANQDLIYWSPKLDYSARFYAKGHVKATHDLTQLNDWLKPSSQTIVVNEQELSQFSERLLSQLQPIGQIQVLKQKWILLVS